MTENAIVAAARRARPVVAVSVRKQVIHLRPPSLAAMREFMAHNASDQSRESAVAALFLECICQENGKDALTEDDAKALAQMPWFVKPALGEILKIAAGGDDTKAAADPAGTEQGGKADVVQETAAPKG